MTAKNGSGDQKDVRRYLCENLSLADREDYKRIRTNIRFSVPESDKHMVIGVTSSQPSEGKSITAINLAYSFAQIPDKQVLLVDCDMRRPSVSTKLGFNQIPGLSNILAGVEENHGSVKNTYIPSDSTRAFDAITCGRIPPNPSELLASDNMARFIEKMKSHYDFVFLDLPPVGAVTDAQVAADFVDGMIVVLRESYCSRPVLDDCLNQLQYTNVKILGFVLNGSTETASKGYRYKKYNQYGRRYGYGYYGKHSHENNLY